MSRLSTSTLLLVGWGVLVLVAAVAGGLLAALTGDAPAQESLVDSE